MKQFKKTERTDRESIQKRLNEIVDRWKNCSPMMVNARDETDGPPYPIWHNGGPGGQIGEFDHVQDALDVEFVFNSVLKGDLIPAKKQLAVKRTLRKKGWRDPRRTGGYVVETKKIVWNAAIPRFSNHDNLLLFCDKDFDFSRFGDLTGAGFSLGCQVHLYQDRHIIIGPNRLPIEDFIICGGKWATIEFRRPNTKQVEHG